jgi:hypothetical protein
MLRRSLGLTKLYNLVNDASLSNESDPDVARLRYLHALIDDAVLRSYGWDDLAPRHGFFTYRQATRYTLDPATRIAVLDRLLEANDTRLSTL